jgi:DNA-binding NtrC family response regulator
MDYRIIVADDSDGMRDVIIRNLRQAGYLQVFSCKNLKEVQQSMVLRPNLVIIDDLRQGGVAFADRLYTSGQKVIVTSIKHGSSDAPWISKFSENFAATLVTKVKELLP